MNLKGRNFLTLKDFTPEEILYMIDLAADLKAKKKAGELHEYYRGKNIALIFEKTSTRTRCSFEVAAHDLGMGSTYLDPTGSQIGKKESIPDKAIKSFREKVRIKGEKRTGSMLKLASSFFVVAALVIGAIAVTRMDDIRKNQAGSYEMNTEENEADRIYTNADSTAVVQGGNRTASDGFAAKEADVGAGSEEIGRAHV